MIRNRSPWRCIPLRTLAFFMTASSMKCEGRVSDHFDGQVFSNPGQIKSSSVAGYL